MIKKLIFCLLLLIASIFLLPKNVFADAGCDLSACFPPDCSALCYNCSYCLTPTPRPPTTTPSFEIKNPVLPENLSSMEGTTFLQKFLNVGISLVFIIGTIYFFFTLIMGAIRWISSSGDKTQLEAAQKQITNAFVGLVILFMGFAIIKLIESLFGINILKITLPTI